MHTEDRQLESSPIQQHSSSPVRQHRHAVNACVIRVFVCSFCAGSVDGQRLDARLCHKEHCRQHAFSPLAGSLSVPVQHQTSEHQLDPHTLQSPALLSSYKRRLRSLPDHDLVSPAAQSTVQHRSLRRASYHVMHTERHAKAPAPVFAEHAEHTEHTAYLGSAGVLSRRV